MDKNIDRTMACYDTGRRFQVVLEALKQDVTDISPFANDPGAWESLEVSLQDVARGLGERDICRLTPADERKKLRQHLYDIGDAASRKSTSDVVKFTRAFADALRDTYP